MPPSKNPDMGSASGHLGALGIFVALLAIFLAWSYWTELPKYQFEKTARETAQNNLAGVRLVSASYAIDPFSPISWFKPPATTLDFASPDEDVKTRFWLMAMLYKRKYPSIFILDVDCGKNTYKWSELARDLFGSSIAGYPAVTPDGRTYQRATDDVSLSTEWRRQFCDTDWTAEREAAIKFRLESAKKSKMDGR